MSMDRREALKSLTALAGATGASVTPVTTREADGVEVVLLKVKGRCSHDTMERLRETWLQAVADTALAKTKVLVLDDGLEVEFVRTRATGDGPLRFVNS